MTRGKTWTTTGWKESTARLILSIPKLGSRKLIFRTSLIHSCNSTQPTLSQTLPSFMAKIRLPRTGLNIVNKESRTGINKEVTSRLTRTGTIRTQLTSSTTSEIKTATNSTNKIKVFMQRELKLIKIWLNTTKRWTMDKWDEFLGELGTKIKWKLLPPNSVNTTVTPRTTESNTTLRNETTDRLLSRQF